MKGLLLLAMIVVAIVVLPVAAQAQCGSGGCSTQSRSASVSSLSDAQIQQYLQSRGLQVVSRQSAPLQSFAPQQFTIPQISESALVKRVVRPPAATVRKEIARPAEAPHMAISKSDAMEFAHGSLRIATK